MLVVKFRTKSPRYCIFVGLSDGCRVRPYKVLAYLG